MNFLRADLTLLETEFNSGVLAADLVDLPVDLTSAFLPFVALSAVSRSGVSATDISLPLRVALGEPTSGVALIADLVDTLLDTCSGVSSTVVLVLRAILDKLTTSSLFVSASFPAFLGELTGVCLPAAALGDFDVAAVAPTLPLTGDSTVFGMAFLTFFSPPFLPAVS